MPIRVLPPLVVNQIAAGEVVERPASVVKELIENALDAGATRIAVQIESGGRDLVRVSDDGAGIAFDELPLAIAPHATSKIAEASDLEGIATLGFRGEALASIAAVSRLSLLSRPRGAEEAGAIEVEGGFASGPRPAPGPPGTSVTVRSLFYNTPARRKFLRADSAESGRVARTLESIALGHPGVAFSLDSNNRRALELAPCADRLQRALDILGRELIDELLRVEAAAGGIVVGGLAGRPGRARPTARHPHVFLNGRAIGDRGIMHALREAYRGLIDPARHPTAVLFLEMDPRQVDVNVHPAKSEVRFREPAVVHGAVLSALRGALGELDLTPDLDLRGRGSAGAPPREFGAGPGGFDAPPALPDRDVEILPPREFQGDALQVHRKYLVAEDEQGLVIVDQHALHERVMFEKLLEAVERGDLESQRMLLPATIEVDPLQLEALESLQPLLNRLGFDVEPIGPSAIAVHACSSLLLERGVEPGAYLSALLSREASEGPAATPEAALHETLDMMACKAAIKAGDRLSPREIAALLRERHRVERSSRCPHGRPTTVRLTLADLDRHFGRR